MRPGRLFLSQFGQTLLGNKCEPHCIAIPSTLHRCNKQFPQLSCQRNKSSLLKEAEKNENVFFKGMDTEFPCISRTKISGPEPQYDVIKSGYELFTYNQPFFMKYGGRVLPQLNLAYETWGELNERRDNTVMIFTGLSASSHAKSHKKNQEPGWWEKFVGPGRAVDTNKYFVVCTNNIGGCYGSSGPSSINPSNGKPYGTTFPLVSVEDMVHSSFLLLDHLGIEKLHGCLGSSLGGMISLMSAALYPERAGRMISISSCSQSHPSSIAMRYLQRKIIMMDPNWNNGHYYDGLYPAIGMKLAREIATLTYRSGPEWSKRFGRQRIDLTEEPTLCPTFSIENYLEYQGESFSKKYDPNSLLYISKAMDLFDMQEGFHSLRESLSNIICPCMVIGVKTDILFPVWQQRSLADSLKEAGNEAVTYYELNSIYGHDTFLLDLNGVGSALKGFLETDLNDYGTQK
ncbi:serine O-succinyltransferase-like [Argonauta hians]